MTRSRWTAPDKPRTALLRKGRDDRADAVFDAQEQASQTANHKFAILAQGRAERRRAWGRAVPAGSLKLFNCSDEISNISAQAVPLLVGPPGCLVKPRVQRI